MIMAFQFYSILVYVYTCLCVIIYHVGTGRGQKVTDLLKLKLQVVSRLPEAVTGNWTLVL